MKDYVPVGVWLLSDVSYSDECRTKKYFQYAENMFPLFFAILKNKILGLCVYINKAHKNQETIDRKENVNS